MNRASLALSSSGGKVLQVAKLGQESRSRDRTTSANTHRYAVDQPPLSLRGLVGQGHEWRGREDVAKVSAAEPEEAENSRGDRIVGRANPSASGNGLLPGLTPWRCGGSSRRH